MTSLSGEKHINVLYTHRIRICNVIRFLNKFRVHILTIQQSVNNSPYTPILRIIYTYTRAYCYQTLLLFIVLHRSNVTKSVARLKCVCVCVGT